MPSNDAPIVAPRLSQGRGSLRAETTVTAVAGIGSERSGAAAPLLKRLGPARRTGRNAPPGAHKDRVLPLPDTVGRVWGR